MDEVSDDVEHVPLVPGLRLLVAVAVAVAVLGLLERVADDERVQRRVAQRVGLVDQLAKACRRKKNKWKPSVTLPVSRPFHIRIYSLTMERI